MLRRSSSEIPYQTIVALAESPKKPGLLYAGTDDGRLHVTMDDGKRWSEITAALRGRKWISRVVPSQHAEGTVYVTQRGREDDDFAPYIFKSIDYGGTFTSIVNNIPAGSVNVVREDPTDPDTLYVGTDFGAFVSVDGGRRWAGARRQPAVGAGFGSSISAEGSGDRDLDLWARHVGPGRIEGSGQVASPSLI
jgi:hypothetical protein